MFYILIDRDPGPLPGLLLLFVVVRDLFRFLYCELANKKAALHPKTK